MQKVKRNITLDFQRRNNVRVVLATQRDMNQREIVISLYDDGKIFPITNHSGVTAAINVLRPDGKSSSFPAEITGIGEVTYKITAWPVGVAGDVKLSVALHTTDGGRISTDPFILHVAEGLYLGSEIEEDTENQTAFENMMQKLAQLDLRDAIRETNEGERKTNEQARIVAETNRANRENASKSAEDTRVSQENARQSAENARASQENGRSSAELTRQMNEENRIISEATRAANEVLRAQVVDAMIEGLDNLLAIQEAYLSAVGGA